MYEMRLLMQSFLMTLYSWRILTLPYKASHLGSSKDKKFPSYLQKIAYLLCTWEKQKETKQISLGAEPKGSPLY